ncbi:MAG: hypothetical protein AAFX93_15875 [Verrucomicrobiota bacterium]
MNFKKHRREGRNKPWEARWYVDRKLKSRFFATRQERDRWIDEQGATDDLDRWQKIKDLCEPLSLDPLQVVQTFITTNYPTHSISVQEAVESLLETKQHRDKSYYTHLSGFLKKKFEPAFSYLAPYQIDADQLRSFLNGLTTHPVTFRNYRSYLRIFFLYCKQRKWVVNNPVKEIALLDQPPEEIKFHKPGEVRALLEFCKNATNPNYRAMLPLLALKAFAGIRSETVFKMDWSMIDIDRQEIVIPAAIMKKRRKHIMQGLEPNLWEWLKLEDTRKDLGMSDRTFRYRKRYVLDACGVDNIKNGLRHSFATYHVTLHQSADKTALLMPHRSATELWEHYYGAGRSADAEEYFEIVPSCGSCNINQHNGG